MKVNRTRGSTSKALAKLKGDKSMKPKGQSEVFASLKEAARYAGLSRVTFTQHVLPQLPHRRVGKRVLITRTALQRWLEGHNEDVA